MQKALLGVLLLSITVLASSNQFQKLIDEQEVRRIETTLASDSMRGREAFTEGSEKAADFIKAEFQKIGLDTMEGASGYKQTFHMVKPQLVSASATFGRKSLQPDKIVVLTSSPTLTVTQKSGFRKVFIKRGAQFRKEVMQYSSLKENVLVFIDESFSNNFARINSLGKILFKSNKSAVFILGNFNTTTYKIRVQHTIGEVEGANVIGVVPGKSKKDEFVIFSAHYDHLGVGRPDGTDSIYNGANDDASGTTAVIALVNYYKKSKENERTLVFAAFTAEEIGGYGSQYFSQKLDAKKTVAMFNIEMIGTESKWGKNSAYITGFDQSDFGQILQRNLQGSSFTFYPDPYPDEDLFYRSDNATLARLGVPAHTISTSKMDNEATYHKLNDEVGTLDLTNMTEIIKSIVTSAAGIVSGKDMPTRVKTNLLER